MPISTAREYLTRLLEGEELDEPGLRKLMELQHEGLHLDFKHGEELRDRKKGAATLRQYVAGFANSDGGILIIGVSDGDVESGTPRTVTRTSRPGGQPLHEWARNALAELGPYLQPPPRIQTVSIDGTEVLVVATSRSPNLTPCVQSGQLVYYFRIADSTPRVPDCLVADLLLGRRAHPPHQCAIRPRRHSALRAGSDATSLHLRPRERRSCAGA